MAKANVKNDALNIAVSNAVAEGWRVESQTTSQAIVVKGKPINHGIHVFLDVITVGFWLLVHIPVWLINKRQVKILRVDATGNVQVEKPV